MEVLWILSAFAAGLLVGLFIYRLKSLKERALSEQRYAQEVSELRELYRASEARIEELRQQIETKDREISILRDTLTEEKQKSIEAITRLEASEKNLNEQKALLEEMKKEMKDTFEALSAAALKSSSEEFLRLASERLSRLVEETKGRLGEHQTAINSLIKPLQDALKKYEEQIQLMESRRRQDYGSLSEHIKLLMNTHQQLQQETQKLVTALRRPHISGRWGEFSLRRVVELAGMTAHCDFYEQRSVSTDTGRLRPDMVIRLPNDRIIVVDAKAPVDAYLTAISQQDDGQRQKAMDAYVSQVRTYLHQLSSKTYWQQFEQSPEFVVMYLPGESFFSAAIEKDPTLIEEGSSRNVIISTPTTFIALLKAVAYGWQQAELTKNAQYISRLGRELYERFSVAMEHFAKTGSALRSAVDAYNRSVRSFESRVLTSLRRFRELGVSTTKEIKSPNEIEDQPRTLNLPEE
jgi:DNA recombination protein RmuC